MRLHDAVSDYLLHIRHEQGVSRTTFFTYQQWLHRLLKWYAENGYPEPTKRDFNTATLRRYLYHLSGKGLRPRTIRGAFHPIRGLSVFLVEHGALEENPAASIGLPKKDAARRLTVSREEVLRLFDACERQPKPRQIALSRALLSVLVFGGLRRQELCDLHTTDFSPEDGSLLVRSGKGSKSRKVFLPADGIAALNEWLAQRGECRELFLFMLDVRRRVHHGGIASILETLKAIAGLTGNDAIKPHSLRHFAATNLLQNGADIRAVQQFLGHSLLTTTAAYVHCDEERLRSIAHLAALIPKKEPETNVLRLPDRREARDRGRLRRTAR